jgi:riboflavin biosynthesis pyrimidine reductase
MIRQLLPGPVDLESREDIESVYLPPPGDHLRINFVASLDGSVEVKGRSGPLGGPADKAVFMAMRGVADVVLVGAGTARAEDYGPVRLPPEVQERRRARGQRARPPLAVVSGMGGLDPRARLFEPDRDVVVFTTDEVAARHEELRSVAEVVPSGSGDVIVERVVAELRRRGLRHILCEGGPSLSRSLFDAGLVDEMCLTLAPMLAGEGNRELSHIWSGPPGRFELLTLMEGDGMVITRYAVDGR